MHLNNPIPESIEKESKKCARVITKFLKHPKEEEHIPKKLIENCKGICVLHVIKGGFIFSGRLGSGLVIARLPNGNWSAPSAIMVCGAGAGGQIGLELTDFIFILNTDDAVKAFSHFGNVTLGVNVSIAAGPVGRSAEIDGAITLAAIYSYSKTKGLFAGVSLEGTVLLENKLANESCYGKGIKPSTLLTSSEVTLPPYVQQLHDALNYKFPGPANEQLIDEQSSAQKSDLPVYDSEPQKTDEW